MQAIRHVQLPCGCTLSCKQLTYQSRSMNRCMCVRARQYIQHVYVHSGPLMCFQVRPKEDCHLLCRYNLPLAHCRDHSMIHLPIFSTCSHRSTMQRIKHSWFAGSAAWMRHICTACPILINIITYITCTHHAVSKPIQTPHAASTLCTIKMHVQQGNSRWLCVVPAVMPSPLHPALSFSP